MTATADHLTQKAKDIYIECVDVLRKEESVSAHANALIGKTWIA